MPKRRANPEAQLHRSVKGYLDKALPRDAFWTTFPAGGGGKIRGAILSSVGLVPGFPDIMVIHDGRLVCIELKSAVGALSRAQMATIARLDRAGIVTWVCRSIEDVERALSRTIPLRATAFNACARSEVLGMQNAPRRKP